MVCASYWVAAFVVVVNTGGGLTGVAGDNIIDDDNGGRVSMKEHGLVVPPLRTFLRYFQRRYPTGTWSYRDTWNRQNKPLSVGVTESPIGINEYFLFVMNDRTNKKANDDIQ